MSLRLRRPNGWQNHLVDLSAAAFALTAALVVLPGVALAGVPHAVCRPSGDRPETGLSGETTLAEIDAGAPALGFKCNADVVGQYQGEGASWQLTAWQKCAYFDQRNPAAGGSSANLTHPGVVVMDVSDPTNPKATTWLNTPAMIDPWESVKVNPARQLLGGGQRPNSATWPGDGFDVYDISADCTAPALQASVVLPGSFGHTGQWAPDGMTYYITPLRSSPSIVAVDVSDPKNPAEIPGGLYTFLPSELVNPTLHDLEFSKDGNTAYITMFGFGGGYQRFCRARRQRLPAAASEPQVPCHQSADLGRWQRWSAKRAPRHHRWQPLHPRHGRSGHRL